MNRDRKEAAKRLGLEFRKRLQALQDASGNEEIQTAAINLGGLFNDNSEFVIWALLTVGGLDCPAPERRPNIRHPHSLPKTPATLLP